MHDGTILALDVGKHRIGVAEAHTIARIAHPLLTLQNSPTVAKDITDLITKHQAIALVVGLPRNLSGQETDQTRYTKDFVAALQTKLPTSIPIFWQDEALTSHKGEQELEAHHQKYTKADIDALAASYILDDFLLDNLNLPATHINDNTI